MKPSNLKTKIFLDSGDPNEAKEMIKLLGFLDGQTTNPSLISKNPDAQKRLQEGKKFTKEEIYGFYKNVIRELSGLMPEGSISIEVYADLNTTAEQMFQQGHEMFEWIPNAHIKYPTTQAGLSAAEQSIKANMRVNMTLCFTQQQAAAVYAATKGAGKGQVYVSPFVGRLDDRGENGMDLISNIVKMFGSGDGHVELLSASVRTLDHFLYSLALGADIVTAPAKILREWAEKGMQVPSADFGYSPDLKPIPYVNLDLDRSWKEYDIGHELTTKGIEKFAQDWNALVG